MYGKFPEFFRKNSGKFPTFYFSGKLTTLDVIDVYKILSDMPIRNIAVELTNSKDSNTTNFIIIFIIMTVYRYCQYCSVVRNNVL